MGAQHLVRALRVTNAFIQEASKRDPRHQIDGGWLRRRLRERQWVLSKRKYSFERQGWVLDTGSVSVLSTGLSHLLVGGASWGRGGGGGEEVSG